jgi:tetratricopeptide (TPR) repeat protein
MRISRLMFLSLGVLLWFGAARLWAQEDETPTQKQYREDYEQYQKIQAVKDPTGRVDELLKFIQERPKSQLLKNVSADFLFMLQDLVKQNKWDTLVAWAGRFIKLQPRIGETYYYLGQALDSLKKSEDAMVALAKCYILKNPGSDRAKLYLDSIYKRSHQGKTDGLDTMIQKIRSEIGG